MSTAFGVTVVALPQLWAQVDAGGASNPLILRFLHEPFIIPIVAILGGFSVGLVQLIMRHLHQNRIDDIEASLKHSMIERGMSADEIERVLRATIETGKAKRWTACGSRRPMATTESLDER